MSAGPFRPDHDAGAERPHGCDLAPPYWGLRTYLPDTHEDKALELGSEPVPVAEGGALRLWEDHPMVSDAGVSHEP